MLQTSIQFFRSLHVKMNYHRRMTRTLRESRVSQRLDGLMEENRTSWRMGESETEWCERRVRKKWKQWETHGGTLIGGSFAAPFYFWRRQHTHMRCRLQTSWSMAPVVPSADKNVRSWGAFRSLKFEIIAAFSFLPFRLSPSSPALKP